MTKAEFNRLEKLLRYLDRWTAAREKWNAWIDAEYARRLKLYKAFRTKAEGKLLDASKVLKYRDGRVDIMSAAGARAKWKFRQSCDQIFIAIVLKGQSLFGIKQGRADKAHIGTKQDIDAQFEKIARKALRQACLGE
jgi:hypothetical protein